MNIRKNYLYVILSAVFVALGFAAGYFSSELVTSDKKSEIASESEQSQFPVQDNRQSPVPYIEAISAEEVCPIYYRLINEENVLRLYEINQEDMIIIREINFNPNSLPAEDRKKLSAGIDVESVEEGYALIEDYIS